MSNTASGLSLQLALVQTSLIWEAPEENRKILEQKISKISDKVNLIVLPEMFTTGFTMSPENIAQNQGSRTLEWMQRLAKEKDAAITGSLVVNDEGVFYNRLYFVQPNGIFAWYDKRHTFTLAGENLKYRSGNSRTIITYKGFRICPFICYDLRFPVWSRNTENYDLLLYVANWPEPRIAAWDTLLKARAIENMAFVAGVNRIGTDQEGHTYPGHSAVYDPLGASLGFSKNEEILEVTLEKSVFSYTRDRLLFLEDRDEFTINN